MHKQILFFGMLLLGFQIVVGQNVYLSRGDRAFEEMAYPEAILNYEKGLIGKFDKQAMLNLADAYRLTNDNAKALATYAKLAKLNQIPPVTFLHFGQALLKAGLYDEAKTWFARFDEASPSDLRGKYFLESTKSIGDLLKDSANIRLSPFPYNSKLDDFSPIWYQDGILFSSSRGDGDLIDNRYEWNDQPFLDIYFASRKAEKWAFSKPKLLRGSLNTRFHEGTCSWDSLKHIAYFTRNNFADGKKIKDEKGVMNLKLFRAEINSLGVWENAEALPFNQDAYSFGHPAVVPSSNSLIFASDQPGGYGGTDLYIVQESENGWGKIQNLGPSVNTAGNELFPYVADDHTLYFSSDGLGGLGGLDVFFTPLDLDNLIPKNLGAPINSSGDDFGFLIAPDKTWGMISSNRIGGKGGDDLYFFDYQKPLWTAIVLDAETKLPIKAADVQVISYDKADRQDAETDQNGHAKMVLLKEMQYHIAIEADQYRASTKEISTRGQAAGAIRIDTIFLNRPAVHVVTKVLDPVTGFPIVDAKVKVVGSKLSYSTDEKGDVDFYYDPYPDYQARTLDCQPIEPANYCFRFTDEGFFDFDTLKLVYEWDFGDGQRARGIDVRHCFDGPGTYHVTLNLLEPSGAIFLNQSTYDLDVQAQSALQIAGPDTITKGRTAYFDAGASRMANCKIESFQWTIGDGAHYSGSKISHVFHAPGTYEIMLEAGGMGITPSACGQCGTKKIVVLEAGWQENPADSLAEAWYNMEAPAPNFSQTPCQPQEPEDYCYRFEDEGGLVSDSLPFSYIWDFGDGERREGAIVRHCYERPGIYPVKLIVVDPLTDKQISVLSQYDLDVKDLRQVYIESFDTVALGKTFKLDALKSNLDGCNINNVWWDFGDNESDPGPIVYYQYFQEGTYRVQMVVSGTTADGQACSKCSFKEIVVKKDYKAAQNKEEFGTPVKEVPSPAMPNGTVMLEIEKEGFETRKISFSPNPTPGVSTNEIQLKQEIPVQEPDFDETPTQSKQADGSPNYDVQVNVFAKGKQAQLDNVKLILSDASTGKVIAAYALPDDGMIYLPLEKDRPYHIIAKRDGYLSERQLIQPNSTKKLAMELEFQLRRLEVGDAWVLNDLYYDYGKSHIRHDAAWELLKLAEFLKLNPSLKVELSSHTDARGSDDFNLNLSEARAQTALEFLKARGISSNQVSAKGYGETQLTNKCKNGVNCNEQQHQANRRTEIKVLAFGNQENQTSATSPHVQAEIEKTPLDEPKPSQEGPKTESGANANFTILLGTYTGKQLDARFKPLGEKQSQVREVPSGGFYRYYFGYFETEQEVRVKLQELKAVGFKNSALIRMGNK